ncbi:hypothetical protein CBR57_31875, partial [Bacillus thuringiensis]
MGASPQERNLLSDKFITWNDRTWWFGWYNYESKSSNLIPFLVCSAWRTLKTSRILECNGR